MYYILGMCYYGNNKQLYTLLASLPVAESNHWTGIWTGIWNGLVDWITGLARIAVKHLLMHIEAF